MGLPRWINEEGSMVEQWWHNGEGSGLLIRRSESFKHQNFQAAHGGSKSKHLITVEPELCVLSEVWLVFVWILGYPGPPWCSYTFNGHKPYPAPTSRTFHLGSFFHLLVSVFQSLVSKSHLGNSCMETANQDVFERKTLLMLSSLILLCKQI